VHQYPLFCILCYLFIICVHQYPLFCILCYHFIICLYLSGKSNAPPGHLIFTPLHIC
jgi:hypothetical protein